MHRERILLLAGWLSVAIAALHIVIPFLGAPAFRYFGAGEEMARQAEAGSLRPAAMTLGLAVVFTIFGLYAFAGARRLRRPPLLRTGLAVIATLYTLRGLELLPELVQYARGSETLAPRHLAFSFVSLVIGILYLLGSALLWRSLGPAQQGEGSRS